MDTSFLVLSDLNVGPNAGRSKVAGPPPSKAVSPPSTDDRPPVNIEISDDAKAASARLDVGAHSPGHAPRDHWIARGGTRPVLIGEPYSASVGPDLMDAGRGVPHNQIRVARVKDIEAAGGLITVCPERMGSGELNSRHVNVIEPGPTSLSDPMRNPVPKIDRIV